MEEEPKHLFTPFEEALESIRRDILRMASLTELNIENAIKGLLTRDNDLCNKAIADDEEVDQLEKAIDHQGMQIIMRFSPVATDLRQVISTMKVSNNLERISDQAVNIAKRGRRMNKHTELPEAQLIEPVSDLAMAIYRDSVNAFNEADIAKSLSLDEQDKPLNKAHKILIKKLTAKSEENSERIADYINLIFVVRFLERIGDHAVNIGEDCVFAHSAFDIRHGGDHPEV